MEQYSVSYFCSDNVRLLFEFKVMRSPMDKELRGRRNGCRMAQTPAIPMKNEWNLLCAVVFGPQLRARHLLPLIEAREMVFGHGVTGERDRQGATRLY